jgi:ribosomal-protein-alanine N-acetyltransferase
LQEVKKIGVKNVYLEVRCSNQKAIKLYEKYNFKRIGTRKNYYRKDKKNPKEDGLIYNLAT